MPTSVIHVKNVVNILVDIKIQENTEKNMQKAVYIVFKNMIVEGKNGQKLT